MILSHADEFLNDWHLPLTSGFRSINVFAREKQIPNRETIVLESSTGQIILLRHGLHSPYIFHADIPDLGWPKMESELEEKDTMKALEMNLGKVEASRASLLSDSTISSFRTKDGKDESRLTFYFGPGNRKVKHKASFDTSTGQIREVYTFANP